MNADKNTFRIFTRTFWRANPERPDGLEPHLGDKHTIATAADEREARRLCAEWNYAHPNEPLGKRAEYERARA